MADRNSNKESKLRYDQSFIYTLICTNIFVTSAFFILNLYQHLMYSFELKTVDKIVYRRENSSVQVKVGHDKLEKIRPHHFQLWIIPS